jgi:uncharacterized membrane protein
VEALVGLTVIVIVSHVIPVWFLLTVLIGFLDHIKDVFVSWITVYLSICIFIGFLLIKDGQRNDYILRQFFLFFESLLARLPRKEPC